MYNHKHCLAVCTHGMYRTGNTRGDTWIWRWSTIWFSLTMNRQELWSWQEHDGTASMWSIQE